MINQGKNLMKKLSRRIFKRENIVVLLLIITALLSLFEIPQKYGIDEIKVVLAMLGLLAIDSLIEKIGYFEEINSRLIKIERIVAPHPNTILLKTRENLDSFSERISEVDNIFVLAISANNLITNEYSTILQGLKKGTNFKFVLLSPDNPGLQAVSDSSPSSSEISAQKEWIERSIDMISNLAKEEVKGTIELRLFNGLPTTSLLAYDFEIDSGWIQVEPHLYKRSPTHRPLYTLNVNSKSPWIDYYRELIDDVWKFSSEYKLS